MTDGGELKGASVLIVDDAPANLDLLRRILEPEGCQIFFATTGEMALEVAPHSAPDIILLDVMMPGMDGFETCRKLKVNGSLRDVPIIFVTAKTDVVDLAKGFEVGGVDYVTKPVRPLEVVARVGAHLKISRLVEEQKKYLSQLEQARRELQELNATKDRFLSNVGRSVQDALAEISTASASLRNSAEQAGSDQEQLNQRLTRVNASAENLLRLLENILEWPRVQLGQKLDLLETEITDRELGYLLGSLDNLRFLSLAETRVTDAGLQHLLSLKGLQELHLDHTAITDQGLAVVAALQSLQVLDLKDTPITDAGIACLTALTNLRGLYLTRTRISDAGLRYVADLKQLETLILWDTAVGDAGIVHLRSLPALREVILWGTAVTEAGADQLRHALPQCDVSTSMLT